MGVLFSYTVIYKKKKRGKELNKIIFTKLKAISEHSIHVYFYVGRSFLWSVHNYIPLGIRSGDPRGREPGPCLCGAWQVAWWGLGSEKGDSLGTSPGEVYTVVAVPHSAISRPDQNFDALSEIVQTCRKCQLHSFKPIYVKL